MWADLFILQFILYRLKVLSRGDTTMAKFLQVISKIEDLVTGPVTNIYLKQGQFTYVSVEFMLLLTHQE